MSRLAAAALCRTVATGASRVSSYSSRSAAFAPVTSRHFSTDTPGEAAGADAGAPGSQEESFTRSSEEDLVFGRFYSVVSGINRLSKSMLKTDVLHCLDKCDLSLDDVKIDYSRGYYPLGALIRFPSLASFNTGVRQTSQGRINRLDRMSREVWDLKKSYDGKTILLQGIPRNASPEDVERFLCGTNFEPPPFETFLRPGVPEPIKVVLVKFSTAADAANAFIAKNKGFCLNNPISIRLLQ